MLLISIVKGRGQNSGNLRGVRAHPPPRQRPLRGEVLGSDRICNCSGHPGGSGAAGRVVARHPRLQVGPHGSLACRVGRPLSLHDLPQIVIAGANALDGRPIDMVLLDKVMFDLEFPGCG